MICGCPTCQKQFTIQSPGAYTCDGCGNSFNAGLIPQSPPQQITVTAMSHGDTKRLCEMMWTCTLWLIFAPIIINFLIGALACIYIRHEFSRATEEYQKQVQAIRSSR
jgi:hypothetical protein